MILSVGCVTVQPYQQGRLNDKNMDLSSSSIDEFGTNFQSYKEGGDGGNGGNNGSGCGCN